MIRKYTISISLGLVVLLLSSLPVIGQQEMQESLFKEATVLLNDAKKVEAELYSPTYYQKGLELYQKAEKDFNEGKKLDDIRKKLKEAATVLKRSIEITRLSKLTLEELTQARNTAVEQKAPEWAQQLYQQSEELFQKAAEKVEDGKTNEAKKIAEQGVRTYREAELAGIKNRILNDAWAALHTCEEKEVGKYAPITLGKAESLAQQAEDILEENRYEQDRATSVAQEASYEARHALFLSEEIKKIKDSDLEYEKNLLDMEQQFKRIATALNLDLEFDQGFQNPAQNMVESILDLKQKNDQQKQKIEGMSQTVDELSTELEDLKSGQLKELSGKLTELEKIVETERAAKQRITQIEQLFTENEAKIVKEGNDVIIRLYGINFPSGRAIIHPQFFPLLTKVIKAIDLFPDSFVRIEGHTDSRGSNAVNEKLSTDRANSVVQYILANSEISTSHITAIGYGEDRPIASNDTEEGRSLNRRIDVVISQQ